MSRWDLAIGVGMLCVGLLLIFGAPQLDSEPEPFVDYEQTEVTVQDGETGERLGTVQTAIAETEEKRYTGLSTTENLTDGTGMLFVYDTEDEYTYVMREMEFGIDIIFISSNGTITDIHHASAPPDGADGEQYRYRGTGQYVLEVSYNWTKQQGIQVGDTVTSPAIEVSPSR